MFHLGNHRWTTVKHRCWKNTCRGAATCWPVLRWKALRTTPNSPGVEKTSRERNVDEKNRKLHQHEKKANVKLKSFIFQWRCNSEHWNVLATRRDEYKRRNLALQNCRTCLIQKMQNIAATTNRVFPKCMLPRPSCSSSSYDSSKDSWRHTRN